MKYWPLVLAPLASVLCWCASPVDGPSSAGGQQGRWTFPLDGVTEIEVRAAEASSAVVTRDDSVKRLSVGANPSGGAQGYHSPNPGWKETSARDWDMKFVGRRFGNRLVISSSNEIRYIHHSYRLTQIRLTLPASVSLKLVDRNLTGDGGPDMQG